MMMMMMGQHESTEPTDKQQYLITDFGTIFKFFFLFFLKSACHVILKTSKYTPPFTSTIIVGMADIGGGGDDGANDDDDDDDNGVLFQGYSIHIVVCM